MVQEAVRDLRKTLVAAGKGEVWEGEQKQEMRERRTREVCFSSHPFVDPEILQPTLGGRASFADSVPHPPEASRKTLQVVYLEMRKSLMEGERMRVREARKEREEEAARERREQEGRRRKDDQERISIEAEQRLEALRQQVSTKLEIPNPSGLDLALYGGLSPKLHAQTVLRSLAARLQAEKHLEEALNKPKRQQMENQRYSEALRC